MNALSKIISAIINFFILFWFFFAIQRIIAIGVEVKYLNAVVALLTSAILTYAIGKQPLNFNVILKYAALFWLIGFILGITYVSIFDPHDGQGIFLAILWTAPVGWLLGMTIAIIKTKRSLSRNEKNKPQ